MVLRCECGRIVIVERSARRLVLRCPRHGVVLRYYADPRGDDAPALPRRQPRKPPGSDH